MTATNDAPVAVEREGALATALCLLDTLAGEGAGYTYGNGQEIFADQSCAAVARAFGVDRLPGWWSEVAGLAALASTPAGDGADAGKVLDDIVPLSIASTWDDAERRSIVRAMEEYARHCLAALASAPAGGHPDDVAVDRFAAAMKIKLAKARDKGRGGWDDPAQCTVDHLRDLMNGHVAKGDPVDVADFCMMLFHRGGSTAAPCRRCDGTGYIDYAGYSMDPCGCSNAVGAPESLARPRAAAGEDFLTQLRRVNTDRYEAWVGDGQDAGILFDAAELGGEVGELLNVVKKLEREDRGWRGSRAAPQDFADECADVLICLDKLARRKGVDLAAATVAKFNATSVKVDLPHRLALQSPPAKVEG